jgi:hypothetical protein
VTLHTTVWWQTKSLSFLTFQIRKYTGSEEVVERAGHLYHKLKSYFLVSPSGMGHRSSYGKAFIVWIVPPGNGPKYTNVQEHQHLFNFGTAMTTHRPRLLWILVVFLSVNGSSPSSDSPLISWRKRRNASPYSLAIAFWTFLTT